MRHVDEGTLHAWLEGQLDDPVEAARIDDHLRQCSRCRDGADEARTTIAGAEQLLAAAMTGVAPPVFTDLVAAEPDQRPASRERRRVARRWMTGAAWAASVAVAAGIGWIARDLDGAGPVQQTPAARTAAVPLGWTAPGAAIDAPRETSVPPAASPTSDTRVPGTSSKPNPAPTRPPATGEAALPVLAQVRNSDSNTVAAGTTTEPAQGALPPVPADFLVQEAPVVYSQPSGWSGRQSSAFPYSPNTFVRSFSGGSVQPVSGDLSTSGKMMTGGGPGVELLPTQRYMARAPFARPSGEWRSVPRTAAAAQSGMALRGIDGMTPAATMLSADNTVVRTLYQIQPGQTLEIWQGSGVGALTNASTDPSVSTPFPWQEGWSMAVEDVQLLLKGTTGPERLPEFARRLRVD